MRDWQFLEWLNERLIEIHGENEDFDYMHKLRSISSRIKATAPDVDTNIGLHDTHQKPYPNKALKQMQNCASEFASLLATHEINTGEFLEGYENEKRHSLLDALRKSRK